MIAMGAVNALLDAAGKLYAAALDPAEWTGAKLWWLSSALWGVAIQAERSAGVNESGRKPPSNVP